MFHIIPAKNLYIIKFFKKLTIYIKRAVFLPLKGERIMTVNSSSCMTGKYYYQCDAIVCIVLALDIVLIFIGVFKELYFLIFLAFVALFIGISICKIPSSFEADNEKVVFKIGPVKKTFLYSDIKGVYVDVIKFGYDRLHFEQLYAVELEIVKKDGGSFKIKTKFDITTDMLLHDRNKYAEKLRCHKLSKLQRYIDDHINNNIYA